LPIAWAAEIERSISAPRPPTVAAPDERTAQRADAGAQQLRLAAEALQPTRRLIARGLDALQALLAALAHRDQVGLDLPPPSTARRIAYVLRVSGHGSPRLA
jgi:hypothetical protein